MPLTTHTQSRSSSRSRLRKTARGLWWSALAIAGALGTARLWAQPASADPRPVTIHFKTEGAVYAATLHDNPAARDFAKLLPLRLSLRDYARTELIADLPRRLDHAGAPSRHDPSPGDITYYSPWGNIALFYKDAAPASGLIPLGRFIDKVPRLRGDAPLGILIEVADAD